MNTYICLENIRSLYNIGAIFRTCSFYGIYDVILLGYSGKTHDKEGNVILHPEILKTSLGAEEDLDIKLIEVIPELENFASENNLEIVSIEQNSKSVELHKLGKEESNQTWNNKIVVFGNEVTGISEEIMNLSNYILEIRKGGKHNSLNVTTSCGIVLDTIINSN